MPDTDTPTDQPTDETSAPASEDTAPDTTDAPAADDVDVAAMQKALRKANKEAENYRLKVKEYEDASKSEQERLADQLEEQKRRADHAERTLMRTQVAAAKGLPPKLADRLQGETAEELEADADSLLAEFDVRSLSPRPDPSQGAKGESSKPSTDMDSLLRGAFTGPDS